MERSGRQSAAPTAQRGALILTLDIGTSSLRTRLYDAQARHLPGMEARASYELLSTADGGAMLEPQEIFEASCSAIDQLLQQAGARAADIAAVAFSTLACNLLGLDAAGRATTPLYTYADTRPEAEAHELRQRLNEGSVFERTGCLLRTSYAPALLLWLQRNEPELWGRVSRWVSFGDYLFLQLFGESAISQSMAAWSGLLNRHTGTWDAALLEALPIGQQQLPPVAGDGQHMRGLRQPWAARWPALAAVPWFPAIGDGACSNAGSGSIGASRAALSVATSAAMRLLLEEPVSHVPWGLWAYRINSRRTLVGGALNNGGLVYGWLEELLNAGSADEIAATVEQLEPDAHGLTVLPFLAGERSPIWRPDVRAAIVGLRLSTRPGEIIRAGMEAVAYRLALLHRLLSKLVSAELTLVATGGALVNSPTWHQIIADVLGRPVALASAEETSRGAALFALEELGMIEHLGALPAPAEMSRRPSPEHHAIYQRGLDRHLQIYERLFGQQEL